MIGTINSNGTVTAIYCHWDGYPDHNGNILNNHYTSPAKIKRLIKLGNLSALGPEIGKKHNFDGKHIPEWCLSYKRDRGEEGNEAVTYENFDSITTIYSGIEYVYLWDGKWTCYDVYGSRFIELNPIAA